MLGGLDVASSALGGQILEVTDPRSLYLIDGVSARDRGWRTDVTEHAVWQWGGR